MRLREKVCRVLATKDLGTGNQIDPDAVQVKELMVFPSAKPAEGCNIKSVVGLYTKRLVSTGEIITQADLVQPNLVERGGNITVLVDSGNAELSFSGRAEGSGRRGERIAFTTALSKRRYLGQVVEKGVVRVTANQ
ncbi:hypothetical protein F183_A43410 [Bryobacterales bacterium F-183]|nr:hypothetical protein F183_A43410 [Bryobacterales bacterium F-183]